MKKLRLLVLLILLVFILSVLIIQTTGLGILEQKVVLNGPQPTSSGPVNCFDYYHFGSVQANITAQNFNAVPGTNINFNGPITNNNDYPIINGTLYVKILRQRGAKNDFNGPDVVDQFIATDNITIPAKGEVPVSFSWKVPSSLMTGNYEIASFFIVNKKFNLLGLSSTDYVIGNTFSFQVKGQKSDVQFDKAGVEINKTPYFFAAYPASIPSKDTAIISAKISNSTNNDETVDVVWKLYRWDSIDPANFIRNVFQKSVLEANSSNSVQITIPENTDPTYYIIGELTYKDSKSIINVRFTRPEIDRIKLNFPSITNFPIKKGVNSTMFSCLYNSGFSQSVPNGKLILKLTDNNGKTINEYTYQGPVTENMMAVKKDFVSKNNFDHFFLTAQLWQADKLADETKTEYDCNKIDPKLCNPKNNEDSLLVTLLVSGIIILILICGIVMLFLKKKKIK